MKSLKDISTKKPLVYTAVRKVISTPPEGYTVDEWVAYCAAEANISKATLYRHVKKHRAVENESNENEGVEIEVDGVKICFERLRKFSKEALEWAIGYYLEYPQTPKDYIYTQMRKKAIEEKWIVGSIKTFYSHMALINPALELRAKGGKRALDNRVAPTIDRDFLSYHSMETVVMDQLLPDFYVYDENGEIVSPEYYAVVDIRSGKIVGIAPTLGKYNKYTIAKALRLACNYAVPREIYCDNGKPELSKHIEELIATLGGRTSIQYYEDRQFGGVKRTKAKVKNSKAKPIESYFSHLQKRLLAITQERGYKKRFDGEEGDMIQEKLKRAKRRGELYSYQEFFACFLEAVSWWNSHYSSSRKGVVDEIFEEDLPHSPALRMPNEVLDMLFLEPRVVKVRNAKVTIQVNYGKLTYYAQELSAYVGRRVELRFDMECPESCIILDDEQNYIATATLWEKVAKGDQATLNRQLAEKKRVMNAWEAEYKKYTKNITKPHTFQLTPYAKPIKEVKKAQEKQAMSQEELDELLYENYTNRRRIG